MTTGYTLDPTTGKFKEAASTEPKGENGADTPIVVNSLVKITPTFTPVPNIPQCDPVQTQQVVATTSTAGAVYPRGTSTAPSQTSNGDTPFSRMFLKGIPFTPIFSGWRISGFLLGGLMVPITPSSR